MTIKEQKRQIVLMQCEILDSDLSEEERNEKLKPLFKEFARLKKQEVKKAPKPKPGNSCRLTDQETGRQIYFRTKTEACNFLGKDFRKVANNTVINGFLLEYRPKKYKYQNRGHITIGTIREIAKRENFSEEYAWSLQHKSTKFTSVVEIDRWED